MLGNLNMIRLVILIFSLSYVGTTTAEYDGQYGPYDYTNPIHFQKYLPVVERYHFSQKVEREFQGMAGYFLDDLHYVLRAFPNHHRALNTLSRYWLPYLRSNSLPKYFPDPTQTPDYWFNKAMDFAPHDGVVPMLYAIRFHRLGKYSAALEQYKEALKIIPDNIELHYNLGLLYSDMQEYELALTHAHKAYAAGHQLPGLRLKLERAGKWKDLK